MHTHIDTHTHASDLSQPYPFCIQRNIHTGIQTYAHRHTNMHTETHTHTRTGVRRIPAQYTPTPTHTHHHTHTHTHSESRLALRQPHRCYHNNAISMEVSYVLCDVVSTTTPCLCIPSQLMYAELCRILKGMFHNNAINQDDEVHMVKIITGSLFDQFPTIVGRNNPLQKKSITYIKSIQQYTPSPFPTRTHTRLEFGHMHTTCSFGYRCGRRNTSTSSPFPR